MTQKEDIQGVEQRLWLLGKLGSAGRAVGLLEGRSNPRDSSFFTILSGKSSLSSEAQAQTITRGAILAAPVENDQRAQSHEDQARQPQADEVALGVVQGARACGASKGERLSASEPQVRPTLWLPNLQSGVGTQIPVSNLRGVDGSRGPGPLGLRGEGLGARTPGSEGGGAGGPDPWV